MSILAPLIKLVFHFWYLIPIFIVIVIARTSWFKGKLGEFIVNISAKLFLDKKQYRLIKNVTLPTENGTTQIDHLIVSPYGVFVIETKNMKGWIYGSKNEPYWTQKIFKYSSKFQNPIHQNYKHVKTLEQLLGLKDNQIHSLIVFVGECKFKTEIPESVTYGAGYIRYIKSKKEPVLSQEKAFEVLDLIETKRLSRSFKTDREHVAHVKNIIAEKKDNASCPKCGSEMVLQTAKKGQNAGNQFRGCSRFPQCRGTIV
jgi:hypothetical protein